MIDLKNVSCCLITKDNTYPKEILDHLLKYPFGEVLILTHSDSPYRKHELFAKAKFDLIYYQDDDAICPVDDLVRLAQPDIINVAMKEGHFRAHAHMKATMGLGWGTIFDKKILKSLELYTNVYGQDEVFKRETERILTHLNYPQNRLVLQVIDLPSAFDDSRLWRQGNHESSKMLAYERCEKILQAKV